MKFLSVCENCLQTYYLNDEEVYIPPNMRVRRRKANPYIETWADWVMHIQSYCPICREDCPEHVLENLKEYKDKLAKENAEITKDDDVIFDDE